MFDIPAVRWGQPYDSLEKTDIVHFETGHPIARMSLVNGGIIARDLRRAPQARQRLRELDIDDLLQRVAAAASYFESESLQIAGGFEQSPDQFVYHQSATTGLPEHMCRANMHKNCFVLRNMRDILDALTRGLDLRVFSQGYGVESRGVVVSYQC
ncbi:MAG TPA: aldehyde dehydrogenase, partial [Pirellulaceae bacterium]|nr:aldehyde dehydrogenase [Pirellulaceae bacterium]